MVSTGRRFADDGWAIWIDGDDTSAVYLNEWIHPGGKNYVDIGIHIHGVRATRTLNIYIPFAVERDEIEDISLMLHDTNILCAVFSTACLIDYKKNVCTSELAYHGKTIDLVHLSGTDFEFCSFARGSRITVSLEQLCTYLANDEVYFLFRLPHKSLDKIFTPSVNVQAFFARLRELVTSPVISEKYGYSVRINEARMLPSEINRIGSFHRQKLKKATVTISIDENYELNDANCYRIRRLEKDFYQDLIPSGFECEGVITYQWNQTRSFNLRGHFNFYFNITHNTIRQTSMLVYMLLLLIIGAAGNALWVLVQFLFFSLRGGSL